MSLTRPSTAPAKTDRAAFAVYLPRLLEEPWEGARVVAGSVVHCDIGGLTTLVDELGEDIERITKTVNAALADLTAVAESHGGDVLAMGVESFSALFTGEGRQGRALNAVHAMHDVITRADVPLSMTAGIATGMVHLITAGIEPIQLFALGPTVTRALELAAGAGPGETRSETLDRSAIETLGKQVVLPSTAFIAPRLQDIVGMDPERRPVTIGFATFSGVDRAIQRNPGRAAGQITGLVAAVQRAGAEFDITVLGTDLSHDGGRITLGAGVAAPTDDGEERMIRAARAALETDPAFALRFGIATGTALVGAFGGSDRRTFGLAGDTAELAARLGASAAPGEVLTTHRVVDRATTRYAISEWDPVTFMGIEAQVVPVVVGAELSDGDVEGGLVGRSEERAMIRRLLGELDEHGTGGVVDIVGGPGVGKTRLVTEALRAPGLKTVVVRGEDYRQHIPYGAAARILRGALGIDEDEDPERAGALLQAQVRELTPYLEPLLPLVAEVVGASVDPTDVVAELSDEFRAERTQWSVSQLAVWLTRKPMVVRIENAQWIDRSSADLLSYILARGTELPWLVIATRRPHEGGWTPGVELDPLRIDLEPLAPGASQALLIELRRDDPLTNELSREIVERSGGNPYLLERLAALAGTTEKLPGNVEGAAATQLAHLSRADREVLGALAVLGRRFEPAVAEEILGPIEWPTFTEVLQDDGAGRLRFRQLVVHGAAYRGLSARRRQEVHLEIARGLAARGAPPELLALHFSRAGEHQEVWTHGLEAGRRAMEQGTPVEAAALLDAALAAAHKLSSAPVAVRAEATELLGDAYGQIGRSQDADKAYVAAEGFVKRRRDEARLVQKRAELRRQDGQYPAALRMLTKALNELPKSSGHGERATLELTYARIRLRQGRCREAIERADAAIPLATKADDAVTLGEAHYLRARASSYLEPGTGVEDATTALGLFAQADDHLKQARALDLLGAEALEQGRWDEALEIEERSAAEHELAGDAVGSALAGYHRARVLLDQGKVDDARSELELIKASSRAANHPLGVAISTMHLARAIARSGDAQRALGMLEETLGQFETLEADRLAVGNRVAQAEAHLLGGDVEEALAAAEKAKEVARGTAGVEIPLVGLQRVRGMALVWLGRTREGHVQLIEALEAARGADAAYEEALILDALATLFGDDEAAETREAITERLGIVKLPPFLTVG